MAVSGVNGGINVNHPNIPSIFGYQKPISSDFCRGTSETFLSPTIPQIQMQNGVLLN